MAMTLTPAYGRDYKSQKDVKAAFDGDKDFIVNDRYSPYDGKPVNRSGLKQAGVRQVNIRYARLTKVMVTKVG